MKTIYLASGNAHKLYELQAALNHAALPIKVSGPDEIGGMPEVEETGSTFESNALLKANGLKDVGPSDGWFLADDSGIEIDALNGRPGVISARYAGPDCDDQANNRKGRRRDEKYTGVRSDLSLPLCACTGWRWFGEDFCRSL